MSVPVTIESALGLLTEHREVSWRVEVLTRTEAPLGRLDGVTGGSFDYSIHDTLRASGSLEFSGTPLTWQRVRLQPWVKVRSTITGEETEWPLGVFIPSTPSEHFDTDGPSTTIELYSKLLILDRDKVEETYSFDTGTNVIEAVESVIRETGETSISLTPSDETLSAPMVWLAGTSRLQIINDLLDAANYFSLDVDGHGVYRATPYRAPLYRGLAWTFRDDQEGIYDPQFDREEDYFDVPNKVIAIATTDSEDAEPMVAYALNEDPDSDFSFEAQGFWNTHVEEGVDATSQEILQEIADRRLIELSTVGTTYEISHLLIPLSLNNVARFIREAFDINALTVVQKYGISMDAGALMTTTLREVAA